MFKTFIKRLYLTFLGLTLIPLAFVITVWLGYHDNVSNKDLFEL